MNFVALKTELTTDPIARGYAALGDEAAAQTFTLTDRQVNRETLDGGTLAASIVRAELAALTAADQSYVRIICAAGTMPLTATVKAELGVIFPVASGTRTNLVALMKRPGNRAEELNLGGIPNTSDVAKARRM